MRKKMGGCAGLFLFFVVFAVVRDTATAASFTSFSGRETCESPQLLKPSSVEEIQNIIKNARAKGQKVKALGTRHASSDINCGDDVSLDLANFASVEIDSGEMQATVGVGATHEILLNSLLEQGYSVVHPSVKYPGLSVGGTLATGAHSSSLLHPASISDQVVALTLVDGRGKVRKITGEKLKAANVNIGALGIVIDVTIKIVENYKVSLDFIDRDDSILFNGEAVEWAKRQDYFEMSWFPSASRVVVFNGTYVNINTPGDGRVKFVLTTTPDFIGVLEQANGDRNQAFFCGSEAANRDGLAFGKNGIPQSFNGNGEFSSKITGTMKDVLTTFCPDGGCAWDNPGPKFISSTIEFAFDLNTLPQALLAVRNIIDRRPWCAIAAEGIQIRFMQKSDNYLSPSSGKDVGVFEIVIPLRQEENSSHFGMSTMQEIYQTMLLEFKGRPHWGKNGRSSFADPCPTMPELYPDWDKFMAVKEELDPEGVFENEFFRRLTRQQELPKFKFCAINDKCICSENSHCAYDQICEPQVIGGKRVGICIDNFS
ncbi:hypothetical protein BSKO_04492 [Bryopsis sp. KO-2023]|nr:hypothetical protein BSKO_04492 [Bryopsis sp. KO-2023]